ncbi:hypothetical protein EZS27_011973 [termite gut metagenome]|uniref:Transmembrane protein EpsG n=1 Tax=termite gut metagenome TaxID=433724 RepID=A0A5J4S230_9ZZZZ
MNIVSFSYSIPYLIFFIFLCILSLWEFKCINIGKDINSIKYITICSFLFFLGLRGYIHTDWLNYYNFFNELSTLWELRNSDYITSNFEVGFQIYSIIIKSICPNYFFWQFFSCLIDIFFLHIFFSKYSRYYVLSYIIFLLFGGLIYEINLMRNIKSVLLFIYSLQYLHDRKFKKYIFINVLGCFFHISSVVFLPLYFVLNKKLSLKLIWSFFIIGNIIFLLQIKFIIPIVLLVSRMIGGRMELITTLYMENDLRSAAYGLTIGYIEKVFSFLLFFFNYNRLINILPFGRVVINLFFLYMMINLFFSEASILVERLSFLFIFSYWFIYPSILYLFRNKLKKMLFLFIIFSYGTLKLLYINSHILTRYDNLLFGIESYESRQSKASVYIGQIFNKR